MESRPELLETVELREPRDRWATGVVGAVVEVFPTQALVEIADEQGTTLDLLSVPHEALRIREGAPTGRSPAR